MKYNVEKLNGSQWLDIVNQEADPGQEEFKPRYLQLGTAFFVFSNTAYGKVISAQYNKNGEHTEEELEKYFDEATDAAQKSYDMIKGKAFTPNLLSFVHNQTKL